MAHSQKEKRAGKKAKAIKTKPNKQTKKLPPESKC